MSDCVMQLRALLDGRISDWRGLLPDCTLRTVAKALGGVSTLDASARLGGKSVACTRSSADEEPLTIWHSGETILLVESDLLSAPALMPDFDHTGVHRMDVEWGATTLEGGELLMAQRGLSLIVADDTNVVACYGFSPMSVEDYLATRRVRTTRQSPLGARPTDGASR